MPSHKDAYITSRYSVSNEQLPRPIKFISMPESSGTNATVLHSCTQEGSGINGRKNEDKGERINNGRYATIGRSYNSVYNVDDEDNSNKDCDNGDDDHRNVYSTYEWRRIGICNIERSRQRRKLAGHRGKQWSKKRDTINQFIGSFVLFVSAMRFSLACPEIIRSICGCEDSQNGIILKCSHTDGSQIVYMLRANQINLGLIQQLEMKHSGLKHIPAGFFSGLFIKKLDLSYNNITDIDENSFLGMNSVLQELILHHNNLTQLPSKALTPLSALLRLDLSNNSIGDIEAEHAFPQLSKVRSSLLILLDLCTKLLLINSKSGNTILYT